MKKVVITGGHLTPAVALISGLKKEGGWQIFYFGRKYAMEADKTPSAESQVVPSYDVPFFPITTGRLQRHFTRYSIPSLLKVPIGFFQSLFLLLRIRPDAIVSFGGYVSIPAVVAGFLLQIPILTHEQTTVFGLASKVNSFFAKRVAVSFRASLDYFPKKKVVYTGNPIREEIFKALRPLDPEIDATIKKTGLPVLYITGGSQGAHAINMALLKILPEVLKKYVVIHQSGEKDHKKLLVSHKSLPDVLKKRHLITKYIGPDEIGWVFKKATLVVSRAGANTVCELAALGKPTIFIPLPFAYKGEQAKNAQMLKETGLAEVLAQSKLSGKTLLAQIDKVYQNLENYKKAAKGAKRLVVKDASQRLIAEIKKLVKD